MYKNIISKIIENKSLIKRNFIFLLVMCSIFLAIYTYSAIAYSKNIFGPNPKKIIILILIDLIFILILAIFGSIKLFKFWNDKRSNLKNNKIQTKIVILFSLIASIPTILIAIFSTLFFSYGIQSWFNERTSTAFYESVNVANAYLKEHQKLIEADALSLANNINYINEYDDLTMDLNNYLSKQANDRSFIEATIFQTSPFRIIAQSRFSIILNIEDIPQEAIKKADSNIIILRNSDKVRALIKLSNFKGDTYLMVGRLTDSKVIEHIERTNIAYNEYNLLKEDLTKIQIQFSAVFILIALLLVLSAVWLGIIIASKIATPLFNLINATEMIKAGDFSKRIDEGKDNDEFSTLAKAFNLMTKKLDKQRKKLIQANIEIDKKRHFSESVINGVSSGILVLDKEKRVSMINPQARHILDISISNLKEIYMKDVNDIFPEIKEYIEDIGKSVNDLMSRQITITRNNKNTILLVKFISEVNNKEIYSLIISLDDITELVLAQKSSAWADIAKKIAHEIKNPLTPISLASKRIEKKYINQVQDKDTLAKYVNTITSNVSQIGTMVEEFVKFARMPSPKFVDCDITKIVKDVIFSRECLDNDISYSTNIINEEIIINCDPQQISQVLTNIIKNSEEATETIEKGSSRIVELSTLKDQKNVYIIIEDNGVGFPPERFDRIEQPYVTSKKYGTGLGLAIVKKIIDDHEGKIEFGNKPNQGGARVKISLKI